MTAPRGRSDLLGLLATALVTLLLAPARAVAAPEPAPPPARDRPTNLSRRVVLVTPEIGGEIAAAVVTRLRGELRAARFEMDVLTVAADAPRRGTVEEAAIQGGGVAALGIFVGAGRVEMWAADASAGRTLMQNLPLDAGAPDRRATIVAVKAVDLLKAMLADIWIPPPGTPLPAGTGAPPDSAAAASNGAVAAAGPGSPPATAPVAVVVESGDQPGGANGSAPAGAAGGDLARDRFAIIAGAGWLQADGSGAWAPLVAFSAAFGSGRFAARVTLSALGPDTSVSRPAGSAALAQEIALVELLLSSRPWHRLRGILALGAGAHHLSIDGHGATGFAGVNHGIWSMATTAGGGVAFDVLPRLLVALDARAMETWPATTVQIDGAQATRIGRPVVWLALGAGVRFP